MFFDGVNSGMSAGEIALSAIWEAGQGAFMGGAIGFGAGLAGFGIGAAVGKTFILGAINAAGFLSQPLLFSGKACPWMPCGTQPKKLKYLT